MADYLTTDTELTSVANAIRTKGGTSASLIYPTGFVSAINAIPSGGGTDVSDTTATAADVRTGKYFYTSAGVKTQGTIQNQAAQTITPGTTDQTIASGKYLSGTQTIKGDANLIAGNIKQGVTIFGVQGTHSGGTTPSGTISITQNGTYDVTNYASANVNVSGGGGITLKRIAGHGTQGINVSGWGDNDFERASQLNQNPPRILFGNIVMNNKIYPVTLTARDGGSNTVLGGFRQDDSKFVKAVFVSNGTPLNYATLRLEKFYVGGTDDTNLVGDWEIYSNAPSVPQFTFDVEFDGEPVDSYTADEGIKWENWLGTEYNVDNVFQEDGENVVYDVGGEYLYLFDNNGDPVMVTDEIVQGTVYQLMYA